MPSSALKKNDIYKGKLKPMDVFSKEPPGVSPLFACENFIATPHLGGGSQESILDMGRVAIDNLYNIMDGK